MPTESQTDLAGAKALLRRAFAAKDSDLPAPKVYFIGIKGTGMCALAQLLHCWGCCVSGSDVAECFYTDKLLADSGIPYHQGFAVGNLAEDCDLVVYSAAYGGGNVEYAAAQRRCAGGWAILLSYPQVLGCLGAGYGESIAVAGAHGKTTSTLLGAALLQGLELGGGAIAGAAAVHLGGRAFLSQGRDILLAETCEYRNHFFHFDPDVVLLTSLEWDHQDFFSSYAVMRQSFVQFLAKDSVRSIVYCADDPGASELVASIQAQSGKEFVPYGQLAQGCGAVASIGSLAGETVLNLCVHAQPLRLLVPGAHLALNALGILLALYHSRLLRRRYASFGTFLAQRYAGISRGLESFRGASRRCELLGQIPWRGGELLLLDDYAHHPTAVRKTLDGLRRFYPDRRLVLDFMPHTYSRSRALHEEFSRSFRAADQLILHDIYASAREQDTGGYSGTTLYQAVNQDREQHGLAAAHYFSQPLDALEELKSLLAPGDLFVTMGAGNNRQLALVLLEGQK